MLLREDRPYETVRMVVRRRAIAAALLVISISSVAAHLDALEPDSATGPSAHVDEALVDKAKRLESEGDEVRAAEGYLYALAAFENGSGASTEAFSRLKSIYTGLLDQKSGSEDDGNKNPEDFFGALRNVYENFKVEGRYDRAINALEHLLLIHKSPYYYRDLGNIYLYGMNDAQRAIENFETAFSLGCEDHKVYTDLGLAYELLGDYDKAIISYKRASLMAPLESWTLYGLRRVRGIELARAGQLVKDWLFIGPFAYSDISDVSTERILRSIDAREAQVIEHGKARAWFRPYTADDHGYVNLNNIFRGGKTVRAYALTYVHVPEPRRVSFRIGSDDGVAVWVNREMVWNNPVKRAAMPDNDVFEVTLRKGWNAVLLEITQDWGGWGFYFRVTDSNGEPAGDLIFDPMRDDARARKIAEERHRAAAIKAAKEIFVWAAFAILVAILIGFTMANLRAVVRMRKMRKNFVSSITHDLRVPLSAIMASTEMLQDGSVREERKAEYYDAIATEASRLKRYIDKILDVSRPRGRKVPYSFRAVDLAATASKAAEIYRKESPSGHLSITVGGETGLRVKADEEALIQVVINLLSNADKYSPNDKRIEVSVFKRDGMGAVAVRDHGIGIPPKDRRRLFRKFFRSSEAVQRGIQGIGIGLAAVKTIVESHQGRISFADAPGGGTVFTAEFPLDRQASAHGEATS